MSNSCYLLNLFDKIIDLIEGYFLYLRKSTFFLKTQKEIIC